MDDAVTNFVRQMHALAIGARDALWSGADPLDVARLMDRAAEKLERLLDDE